MAPRDANARRLRVWRCLGVFFLLLTATMSLQWAGSAYSSELDGADESAHFITGLMIRDYIAAGFPTTPIRFAEDYYMHYPKVAFGMWGPLMHVAEAGWTLVFPATRSSVLVLMAVIAASTALLIFAALEEEFGLLLALAGALIFVAIPAVQRQTGMVMADGLVGLFDFSAAHAFGRFLDSHRTKHAVQFALLASLSILTKGNGMALALLPAFGIAFTGQFKLLKSRPIWLAAGIVVCIAGPWQYYSTRALWGITDRQYGSQFFAGYARALFGLTGIWLVPVIAIGLYVRLIGPAFKRSLDGKWAAAGALICSILTLHSLIPVEGVEVRYMITAAAPLVLFLIGGIDGIAGWLRSSAIARRRRSWAVAALVSAVFLTTAFSIPRKNPSGFAGVADLLEKPAYKSNVVLISSSSLGAEGEGTLISEVAMREHRPSHIVLRATKMLSQSDWMGNHYTLLYKTPAEVMKFLKSIPVGIVVVQTSRGSEGYPDHRLLQQTISAFSNDWEQLGKFAGTDSSIAVYHLKSFTQGRIGKIRIDLPYTLGHSIER